VEWRWEKTSIGIGLKPSEWQRSPASRKQEGSDLAAGATSMRRKCYWLLPWGVTHIKALVGNPHLTDRECAWVAVSSKAVTEQATTGYCNTMWHHNSEDLYLYLYVLKKRFLYGHWWYQMLFGKGFVFTSFICWMWIQIGESLFMTMNVLTSKHNVQAIIFIVSTDFSTFFWQLKYGDA
jgi:hypothetical protein